MLKALNFLTKVPVLGPAVGFLTSNIRLVVEYILIAVLLAVAGVAVTLWFQSEELSAQNKALAVDVATATTANAVQDATIADLRDMREKDGAVVNGLVKDFKELATWNAGARAKLAELEKQNARVREYLDQPIPPELVCVLDGCPEAAASANGTGQGKASRRAPSAVRAGKAASAPDKSRSR